MLWTKLLAGCWIECVECFPAVVIKLEALWRLVVLVDGLFYTEGFVCLG